MKRATPTPNRFITFTPSWWVNGFVLFIFIFLLDGCVDETSLVGFKKEPRMEVKFKEFSIPATTVQTDSVSSQNIRSSIADRWLCGIIDNPIDPNFGKIQATIFTKLKPGSKIYSVNRTDFVLTKATLNLVLDYYVYGDTLNSESTFSLHEITDGNFNINKDYYTNSSVSFNSSPISTGTYQFKYDSIKKYNTLNTGDTNSANNVYDTLTFDLPVNAGLAKILFDTVRGKGIYHKQKKSDGVTDTLVYSTFKNDSTFLKSFNGIAIVPQTGNRVLGFASRVGTALSSSRLTLYYTFLDLTDNVTKNGQYNYYFQDINHYQDIPSFSKIDYDRSSTLLAGLSSTNKYSNFDAPDGFCYVQSGTGLYSKLDFTEVMDTFALYDKITFNSAELIIPMESTDVRSHIKTPPGLYLRVVKDNYRFFVPPLVPAIGSSGNPILVADPIYGNNYYTISNETYLDAVGDDNDILNLQFKKDDNGQYYRGYLTQFFEYHSRLPSNIPRVNYMGLVPATFFGKSLNGVSFRNDQIKLRVYYSVPK